MFKGTVKQGYLASAKSFKIFQNTVVGRNNFWEIYNNRSIYRRATFLDQCFFEFLFSLKGQYARQIVAIVFCNGNNTFAQCPQNDQKM
jgi:hypothetical protein